MAINFGPIQLFLPCECQPNELEKELSLMPKAFHKSGREYDVHALRCRVFAEAHGHTLNQENPWFHYNKLKQQHEALLYQYWACHQDKYESSLPLLESIKL